MSYAQNSRLPRRRTTGGLAPQNTHPFEQHGRLLAHNGVIEGLPALEAQLGSYRELVHGDTDSERFFALVTRETDRNDGDVSAGLTAAAHWVARSLPLLMHYARPQRVARPWS